MTAETDAELREALGYTNIAVVGASTTPTKDAHNIPRYMQRHGYTIIPVNPNAEEVLGEKAYDTLSEVQERIDMVNVFRPSAEVAGIVDAAIEREDVKVIWTQLGIRDDDAAERAERAGKMVIQNKCLKVEYARLN
jgi:predicted CoA-binding protein